MITRDRMAEANPWDISSFYAKFGQNLDDEEALANLSMAEVMRVFTESAKVMKLIFDQDQMAFSQVVTPPTNEFHVPVTHDERMVRLLDLVETAKKRARAEPSCTRSI